MRPTRRQILKWGFGATAIAGAGVAGKSILLPPAPSAVLAPVPELAARLFEVLNEEERADAVVEYEHPAAVFHYRVQNRHRYRVATTSYVAAKLAESVGKISSEKTGAMLRDVSISHLQAEGFASFLS